MTAVAPPVRRHKVSTSEHEESGRSHGDFAAEVGQAGLPMFLRTSWANSACPSFQRAADPTDEAEEDAAAREKEEEAGGAAAAGASAPGGGAEGEGENTSVSAKANEQPAEQESGEEKREVGEEGGGEGAGESSGEGGGETVQEMPLIGPRDDPFERQAERVASAVTHGGSGAAAVRPGSAAPLQRACAACAHEEEEEEEEGEEGASSGRGTPKVQRMCRECAEERESTEESEDGERVQRFPEVAPSQVTSRTPSPLDLTGGAPLSSSLRRQVEPVLGHNLSHVRVHADTKAQAAARSIHSRAFTHRHHIWLGTGESAGDTGLMAHELTHVVQQGAASRGASAAAGTTAPPIQRFSPLGALKRGARWVGRQAKKGFIWAVRRVSSALADVIDKGPIGWLKDKLKGWIGSALGALVRIPVIGPAIAGLAKQFSDAFGFIKGVLTGDPKSCAQFRAFLDGIRKFASAVANSWPVQALVKVFSAVWSVLKAIGEFIIAPVIEVLGTVLKAVWDGIKALVGTVIGWFKKVKSVISHVWNWVKEKLGFERSDGSGEEESGVWAWIKRKANAAWNAIKEPFLAVARPIATVVKVLFFFTGPGAIYAIIKYGPELVESAKWLWAHWDDPQMIRRAHKEMGHTFLPGLLNKVRGIGDAIQSAADWVMDKASSLLDGALTVLGALTGIPLLGILRKGASLLVDGAKALGRFVTNTIGKIASAVQGFVARLGRILAPYKEVLSSLALAIINPPMIPIIFAGWAWRLIPDNCIKAAILDFLLDILIAVLERLPDLAFFGPIWPMLKHGVLGFLRGLRKQDSATKEKVSNKLAKIVSGASLDFVIGFVKGFLKGVWDGIADPFRLIFMVVDGLGSVVRFFANLAADALGGWQLATAAAAGAVSARETAGAAAPREAAPATAPGEAPAEDEPAPTAPEVLAELGSRASQMAGELSPDVAIVRGSFWDAAHEYFQAGEGASASTLLTKLGEAWDWVLSKLESAGAELAEKVVGFFNSDAAESEVGEGTGWLAGTIVFQIVLDILTAGTWAVAYPIIGLIVRFMNWPMKVLGKIAKAVARLGRTVVNGVRSLGSLTRKAVGSALGRVSHALGTIGERLVKFGEEIVERFLGRTGGRAAAKVEQKAAQAAGREAAELAEREGISAGRGAGAAEREAAAARPQSPSSPAERAALVSSASKEGSALSKTELDTELALAQRSGPRASTKAGYVDEVELPNGHVWRRTKEGRWCRFSEKNPFCPTGAETGIPPSKVRERTEMDAALKKFKEEGGQVQEVKAAPPPGEMSRLAEEAEEAFGPATDPVLQGLLRVQGTHRDTFFRDIIVPNLRGKMPSNSLFSVRDWEALESTLGIGKLPWKRRAGPDLLLVDVANTRVMILDLTRTAGARHAAKTGAYAPQLQKVLPGWTVEVGGDFFHAAGITTKQVVKQIGDILREFGYKG